MYGLSKIDIGIIVLFFLVMVAIGIRIGKRQHSESDYFLGGRRMGFWLQLFMNFGMATSSDTAVGAARETYREGLSGIWIKLFVVFITPFYWITTVWLRRLRLNSMAEIFSLRYNSSWMSRSFAVVGMLKFMAVIAVSLVALQKTVEAITPISEPQLSSIQLDAVRDYARLSYLDSQITTLTSDELSERSDLRRLKFEGAIKPYFSHINAEFLLPICVLIVLIYSLAGGIEAAAVTDLIQGALLLVLSVLILPFGLAKIGGFKELHERLPESVFSLFGTNALNEYTWWYVASIVLVGLVIVESEPQNAQIMGSAKNEETARTARVTANFMKRLTIILWGFTGIVGLALYQGEIADPDMLWGHMTLNLLPTGLIGLMIVCLMAALMSTADAYIVSTGALFIDSIYKPFRPNLTSRQYLFGGRVAGAIVLIGATLIALYFNDILSIIRFSWSIGLIFGPVFLMGVIWRRTTATAAWAAILYSAVITVGASLSAEQLLALRSSPWLTQTTVVSVPSESLGSSDPAAPLDAQHARHLQDGLMVVKQPVFFEKLIPVMSTDAGTTHEGRGRLRISLILPSLFGVELRNFRYGNVLAIGLFLDVAIPFGILIIVSLLSSPVRKANLVEFYARLHTPVAATPELDKMEVALSVEHPDRWRSNVLMPRIGIELLRPTKRDILGFIICWICVGLVVLTLVGLSRLGA